MGFVKKVLSNRAIDQDAGLLILRLGIGFSMVLSHGWGKITAGPGMWSGLGKQMTHVGIDFAPVFWGFMASFSEFFCSILIILGLFFRPAAGLLAFTMLVATLRHLNLPDDDPKAGWSGASHALELLTVYVTLIYAGAGRYAIKFPWDRSDMNR